LTSSERPRRLGASAGRGAFEAPLADAIAPKGARVARQMAHRAEIGDAVGREESERRHRPEGVALAAAAIADLDRRSLGDRGTEALEVGRKSHLKSIRTRPALRRVETDRIEVPRADPADTVGKEIPGVERVGEGAVVGARAEAGMFHERRERVARGRREATASDPEGAEERGFGWRHPEAQGLGGQPGDVGLGLVREDDGATEEGGELVPDGREGGGAGQILGAEARELGDDRRQAEPRVDEGMEGGPRLDTARRVDAEADGANLDDAVMAEGHACRLEIERDEGRAGHGDLPGRCAGLGAGRCERLRVHRRSIHMQRTRRHPDLVITASPADRRRPGIDGRSIRWLAADRHLCYRTPAMVPSTSARRCRRPGLAPRVASWCLGLALMAALGGCAGNEVGDQPVSRCVPEGTCDPAMFRAGLNAALGDATRGRALFDANCARCHGSDGVGLAEARRIDMGSAAWQASMRDAGIVATVRAGRGAAMPAFRFTDDEHRDLLAFIRSLVRAGEPAAAPPTDDNDRGGY
jgi:cytochrome c553